LKPVIPKVDYKKDIATVSAGTAYWFAGLTGKTDEDDKPITEAFGIVMDRSSVKAGIPFTGSEEDGIFGILDGVPTGGQTTLTVWSEANGARPRSRATSVIVYSYSAWSSKDTTAVQAGFVANSKFPKGAGTYKLPKGYEVRPIDSTGKWEKSIKNVIGDDEWEIRRIGTASFDAKNTKTWINDKKLVTSATMKLTFKFQNWWDPAEGKTGEKEWDGLRNRTGIVVTALESN